MSRRCRLVWLTGPRFVVQIGDKMIDYNEEFRLFLTTRNPNPEIPADAASVITEVNFTTTRAGLTSQVCLETLLVMFVCWMFMMEWKKTKLNNAKLTYCYCKYSVVTFQSVNIEWWMYCRRIRASSREVQWLYWLYMSVVILGFLSIVAVSHDHTEWEARTRGAEDSAAETRGRSQNPTGKVGRVTAWGLHLYTAL